VGETFSKIGTQKPAEEDLQLSLSSGFKPPYATRHGHLPTQHSCFSKKVLF
jgi:hypothetical protein